MGVLLGSRAYARHVRSRPGGGALVNIERGVDQPLRGLGGLLRLKAAVDHLTQVVAIEEADAGLRALAVAPGVVDTDMQAAIRTTTEDFPSLDRFLGPGEATARSTARRGWPTESSTWRLARPRRKSAAAVMSSSGSPTSPATVSWSRI